MTALHRAIIHGHTDVVHILLKAGCLIDQKDEVKLDYVLYCSQFLCTKIYG